MSGFASQGELLMSLITKDGSGQISRDDLGAAMKKAGLPTEQLGSPPLQPPLGPISIIFVIPTCVPTPRS